MNEDRPIRDPNNLVTLVGIDPGPLASGIARLILEKETYELLQDPRTALDSPGARAGIAGCSVKGFNREPNDIASLMLHMYEPAADKARPIAALVIEKPVARGQPAGSDFVETVWWAGRLYERSRFHIGSPLLLTRNDVLRLLTGKRNCKPKQAREATIDFFGGRERAIGGKRCHRCHGKGWRGRNHDTCIDCRGSGYEIPPGPLYGFSGDHAWDALMAIVAKILLAREEASRNGKSRKSRKTGKSGKDG